MHAELVAVERRQREGLGGVERWEFYALLSQIMYMATL